MSETAKKHLTSSIRIIIGRQSLLFLVPKEKAKSVAELLSDYEREDEIVDATDVFPVLKDAQKRPGTMLQGARLKEGLSQEQLARKLGISQANLSKMEIGSRSIGKKMARRLAKVLNVNYRLFL